MKFLSIFLFFLFTSFSPIKAMEKPAVLVPFNDYEKLSLEHEFARKQLVATVKLYDDHLRVPLTGQYLDKIDLSYARQESAVSSIASTGVGLMSLAIGDRLGAIDSAAHKAAVTLENLLNEDKNAFFYTPRSQNGWYKHFINAYSGKPRNVSQHVFSTIDTAILGVGAFMVARYFEEKAPFDKQAEEASQLAWRLVESIDWAQSIRFGDKPGFHQIFHGEEEKHENRFWSHLFDEYVTLACLGRAVEVHQGKLGNATRFWKRYLEKIENLPQAEFEGHSLLAVNGRRFTSHFTQQFGFYFCGDLSENPVYQKELYDLSKADRAWFSKHGEGEFPTHWWGLGAGSEIKFNEKTGHPDYSAYGVARIGKNPHFTFSPAIMAGFLPVEGLKKRGFIKTSGRKNDASNHSPIINDLMTLYNRNECRYHHQGLDFLWRCSARNPSLKVSHVEGVDLSTYLLGLTWFDKELGEKFFNSYGVKARPAFSRAQRFRADYRESTEKKVKRR